MLFWVFIDWTQISFVYVCDREQNNTPIAIKKKYTRIYIFLSIY
jgi:hypothetical protein